MYMYVYNYTRNSKHMKLLKTFSWKIYGFVFKTRGTIKVSQQYKVCFR